MAYDVDVTMPKRILGKSDVSFVVKTEDGVLGTLKVSKGALVWYPKKTSYGRKVTWKRFHAIAVEHFPHGEFRS
jgi:hypothetical protein